MQNKLASRAPRLSRLVKIWWVPICMLFVAACHTDMYYQPKYEVYEESQVFPDGAAMQPPVAGTVNRGNLRTDEAFFAGTENGQQIQGFPSGVQITPELVAQGQKQYNIYCITCHGQNGNGRGTVSGLLNPQPPAFVEGELVGAPAGRYFQAITNGVLRDGKLNMYPYASRVAVEDRWAIIAFIRALQQNPEAPLEVPVDQIQ